MKKMKFLMMSVVILLLLFGGGKYIVSIQAASTYDALVKAAAAGGTYTLENSIEITDPIVIPEGKTLTLLTNNETASIYPSKEMTYLFQVKGQLNIGAANGKCVKLSGEIDYVQKTTTSIIYVDGGTVTINNAQLCKSKTRAVFVNAGTCIFKKGLICENQAIAGNRTSGGAVMIKQGATFNMTGGEIKQNEYGGVFVSKGATFNMEGGSISDNLNGAGNPERESIGYGSGVYVDGTFNMKGGTIKNNKALYEGDGICVTSNAKFTISNSLMITNNDVYLAQSNAKVYIGDTLTGDAPVLTITPFSYNLEMVVAESSIQALQAAAFIEKIAISNDEGKEYYLKENKLQVLLTEKFIITYDGNGGTNVPENQSAFYKENISASNVTPTRVGFTFKGWNTKLNGSGTMASTTAKSLQITEDITLYAQWKENEVTVKYDLLDGENGPQNETQLYSIGIKVSDTVPTKEGYIFNGWNTQKDGTGKLYKEREVIQENLTLYAQWKSVSIMLTYDANGGTDVPEEAHGNFNDGIIISSSIPIKKDYVFASWNTKIDGSGQTYLAGQKIQSDLVLYAQWGKEKLVLSYHIDDGYRGPEKINVNYNNAVVISDVTPIRIGYIFYAWNTEKDGKGDVYMPGDKLILTSDTILYAIWQQASIGATKADIFSQLKPTLNVSFNGKDALKLSWSFDMTAGGCDIYYAEEKAGKYKKCISQSPKKSELYTNEKLNNGATCYFKVVAYYMEGEKKVYSKESSIQSGIMLKAPKMQAVKNVSKNKIKISWEKDNQVSGYIIYEKIGSGSYKKKYTTSSKNTVSITVSSKNIKKGKKCYYKVKSYKKVNDKKIYSTYSNIKNVVKK